LVIFARDRARLDRTWLTILLSAGGGTLGLFALLWLVVRRAVGAGLQPVHALAREVTAISSTSLEKRVSDTAIPEELRPIVAELNRLLEHLQSVFQRERRFTSDAAHELSTPVAELRSLTDVALRWRDDPAVTADLAVKTNAIAQQMERIVRVLLALARAENCRAQMQLGTVDVALVTRELVDTLRARCAAKTIGLRGAANSPALSETDPTLVRALLFNVLDNAVEHSPPGSAMDFSVHREGALIRVIVSNTQQSLVREDLPHIFEPLWRKDTARTDGTHCGVGLALVKAYAEALGATVCAELVTPDLFRMTVTLPAYPENRKET
jgi:signal transduction histidine kinase